MPWVDGKWVPESDSVSGNLTGLLASDSPYIATARAAGERTAARRGLLNSSIAAGAGESAAIAAAAPIASQDSQQTYGRNQAVLEGDINLGNQTTLNTQQNTAQTARDQFAQTGALETQSREFAQRTAEQTSQLSSQERVALLNSDSQLRQEQIGANSQLSSQYLQAFSTLANDPNVPADVRNSYISEFQRVMTQGQGLIAALPTVPLNWNAAPTTPPPYSGPPENLPGANPTEGQTYTSSGGQRYTFTGGRWNLTA